MKYVVFRNNENPCRLFLIILVMLASLFIKIFKKKLRVSSKVDRRTLKKTCQNGVGLDLVQKCPNLCKLSIKKCVGFEGGQKSNFATSRHDTKMLQNARKFV